MIKIPEMLLQSQRTIDVHNESVALRDLSSKLYVAVLHALGHILGYYQQKAKVFKAIGSQGAFEKELVDKINEIVQFRNALDEEAKLCDRELLKETRQHVQKVKLIGEASFEKVSRIEEKMDTLDMKQTKTIALVLNFAQELFLAKAHLEEMLQLKEAREKKGALEFLKSVRVMV